MGFVIILSYISYPILWHPYETLAFRLLKEIHDEVMLYKNETGNLPENLDNLLYYDIEKRTISFQSKPLRGKLSYLSVGFPEPELKGYDINKVIHYKIIDNKPIIYTLGPDNEEGGCYDHYYPRRKSPYLPIPDFVVSEFFLRTLGYGFLYTSALTMCLYRIWKKRVNAGTGIEVAIFISIVFVLFECIGAFIILAWDVYPHH